MPGQTCPRCSVSTISARTGKCELCGFQPGSGVAVAAEDVVIEAATRELTHEFELGPVLGRGKHSAQLKVRERSSGRALVLKVAARRPDAPDAEESFRAMLGMFVRFEHPHLAPVLRHGSTDSLFWYVSEDLEATTLRARLQRDGVLDPRTCRRIATQTVSALEYLHRHGVVHGALKADNILLDKDGWVRVCDPSFIRARWKRRSRSTPARGITPEGGGSAEPRAPWVAPEDHERGERLPAADQYALAAMLYECLAGHPPESSPRPLLDVVPGVPASMARAIDTALATEPFRRFASCAEFLFALEEGTTASIAAVPTPSRGTARVSQDVVMIRGWEPPEVQRQILPVLGRVAAGLVVVAALWWSAPFVMRTFFPPSAPTVSTPAPARTAPPITTSSEPAVGTDPPSAAPRPAPTRPAARPPAARTTAAPAGTQTPARPPVQVPAAPPPAVEAAAEPARLFVNATPWGVLYIDGELVGNTPKANHPVSPGQHTIRVIRAGYEPFERTVRLQSGEVLRITDIVLVPTIRP